MREEATIARPAPDLGGVKKPLEGTFLSERDPTDVESAWRAVREEYESTRKIHGLNMRSARPLAREDWQGIVEITVGEILDCDSAWEGARVFAPGAQAQDDSERGETGEEPESDTESMEWSADLVEVDQERGLIYVSLDDPAKRPRGQRFFVKPFDYLANLNALYAETRPSDAGGPPSARALAYRLGLSRGDSPSERLVVPDAVDSPWTRVWRSAWGIIWGPPGTGKTTMLGQNLAKVLDDPSERVLVVSTTNRATDEVAIAIGRALRAARSSALEAGRVLRIGRGARYGHFEREDLVDMLKGTETELMRAADDLRQQIDSTTEPAVRLQLLADLRRMSKGTRAAAFEKVADPRVSIVVATAYRATDFLVDTGLAPCGPQDTHPSRPSLLMKLAVYPA